MIVASTGAKLLIRVAGACPGNLHRYAVLNKGVARDVAEISISCCLGVGGVACAAVLTAHACNTAPATAGLAK